MRFTTAFPALLLLGLSPLSQAAMTHMDAELALRHDDNLSRAEASRDQFSDEALDLSGHLQWVTQLSDHSGLRLNAHVRAVEQARFDALSHVDAGTGARYRIQPVSGYTTPWFEIGAGADWLHFRDSDIRDGTLYSVDLLAGKNLTDRVSARLGLEREWRSADEGEVFEWQRSRLSGSASFRLLPWATLYGNVQREMGDQVFTATPAPAFRRAAKAIADDPAFGPRRAYRLAASANTVGLGMHFTLTPSSVLDLGYQHFDADAHGGHHYSDNEVRASWIYRFR